MRPRHKQVEEREKEREQAEFEGGVRSKRERYMKREKERKRREVVKRIERDEER